MQAILNKNNKELILRGISTHIAAEQLTKELNEFLLNKRTKLYFFFEGGPGPSGEGMIIRVKISRKLNSTDITALRNFFKVRNIRFIRNGAK